MVALQLAPRVRHISHAEQLVRPAGHFGDGALVTEGLEGEVAVVVAHAGRADTTKRKGVEHGMEEAVVDGGSS